MKIERLQVSNFRCFGPRPLRIEFGTEVTAFVGNNGSGKTAVIAALGKLFGVTAAQRAVRRSDFHVSPDEREVAPGSTLSIDCVLGFPDSAGAECDAAVPEVFDQMTAAGEGEPLKVRIRLEARYLENNTPEGAVEEEIRWVPTLGDDFVWDRCIKVGIDARSLVQLVYVPASRNAYEQVTNLLKGRLWRAARWSTDLEGAATDAATKLQEQFDAEWPARFIVERLERRWNDVHQGDTRTKPVLRLVENRLENLVRQAEFVFDPDETGQSRRLQDLSDGQRSLFHIALTAATLEIERDALALSDRDCTFDREKLRRTYLTVLAIEEPENSLSPFFLSRIMTQAREIGAMEGAQVAVTSHSASILGRLDPEEVRYCRHSTSTGLSTVRALRLPVDDLEARKFVRLAVKAYPELYFARFVVLAEGESEAIVLPRLAESMGVPLDRSFVPIVPLGGRFVRHFWRLLEGLAIPYATLLDLDLGRRHGGSLAIQAIVAEMIDAGRDLNQNDYVRDGTIDLDEVGSIDDSELLEQGTDHPWLKALRREGVYFSFPIDIDFAMLSAFGDAYKQKRHGRRGPNRGAYAAEEKRRVTLKSGGHPEAYGSSYDEEFLWYPYLFLGRSKPETHLVALGELDNEQLKADAPAELVLLVRRIDWSVPE